MICTKFKYNIKQINNKEKASLVVVDDAMFIKEVTLLWFKNILIRILQVVVSISLVSWVNVLELVEIQVLVINTFAINSPSYYRVKNFITTKEKNRIIVKLLCVSYLQEGCMVNKVTIRSTVNVKMCLFKK